MLSPGESLSAAGIKLVKGQDNQSKVSRVLRIFPCFFMGHSCSQQDGVSNSSYREIKSHIIWSTEKDILVFRCRVSFIDLLTKN